MDIYQLQWPTGAASPAPSASHLFSASRKPLAWLSLLSSLPVSHCPQLRWMALQDLVSSSLAPHMPFLYTGSSSATWSSSQSKDLDEAWLTVVGGSSTWGISVPLDTKKGKISVPRYGYHCGFSKGSPDGEWRSLSPLVCPRRAPQVLCNAGLCFAEGFCELSPTPWTQDSNRPNVCQPVTTFFFF